MRHAGQNGIAVIEHRIPRWNRGGRTVSTLKGDDAQLVIALKLSHANGLAATSRIKREAQNLEFAECIDMRTVA